MTRRADELHPQLQEIEEQQEARLVPESYAVAVETARADLSERLAGLGEYIDDDCETTDFEIEGPAGTIPIRAYVPEADGPHPIVVFYHGGGYVMGDIESHDNVCTALANRGDVVVLSVDYRLAPEHPFPAAVEDGYAALEWAATFGHHVGGDTDAIAVAGDSAGGNLSAAVSLMARERDGPDIGRQLLIYPWLDPAGRYGLDSYAENAREVESDAEAEAAQGYLFEQYARDEIDAGNQYLAPLIAKDLGGLPPATIITGGYDRIRDEGFEFAERLEEAGVETNLANFEAMNHGFVSLLGIVDRADDAMDVLVEDLEQTF
jgi:acetyl esterase